MEDLRCQDTEKEKNKIKNGIARSKRLAGMTIFTLVVKNRLLEIHVAVHHLK
jgi:hypothetical protein